jgi:hypothetical protein
MAKFLKKALLAALFGSVAVTGVCTIQRAEAAKALAQTASQAFAARGEKVLKMTCTTVGSAQAGDKNQSHCDALVESKTDDGFQRKIVYVAPADGQAYIEGRACTAKTLERLVPAYQTAVASFDRDAQRTFKDAGLTVIGTPGGDPVITIRAGVGHCYADTHQDFLLKSEKTGAVYGVAYKEYLALGPGSHEPFSYIQAFETVAPSPQNMTADVVNEQSKICAGRCGGPQADLSNGGSIRFYGTGPSLPF